jgi:uncharacterized caspase-like protein
MKNCLAYASKPSRRGFKLHADSGENAHVLLGEVSVPTFGRIASTSMARTNCRGRHKLRPLVFLFFGFLFFIFADPARAEKRVALVIGISNYQRAPALSNPVHDAEAMGALFKKAGFDIVEEKRDLGILDLRREIRDFSDKSRDADIAVVYYAGHGIEVGGSNYIVPADAKLVTDFDVEDETISLDRLLKALDPVKRLRLVILDACRENPFSQSMKKNFASRSIGRGLATVEPTSNTLVAFSTKAGAVADDGNGENSQYTSALLKYLAEPGVDLRVAFGRVRDEVLKKTFNRQEPFVYGSLGGDNLALVPQPAKPANTEADARIDYEFAAQIGTKEVWDSFVASHPTGFYANLARAQKDKLIAAEQSQATADNARRDAEAQAAQKAEKLQKRLEEPATGDRAAAKEQLFGPSKKELEEAEKQAELAQQRAEAARQEVEQAKRHAVEEAQREVEETRAAKESGEKIAALSASPPDQLAVAPSSPKIGQADITRLLQAHLKRVGCNSGKIGGDWDESSQRALQLFNKNAKTKFETKVASLEALDAVRKELDRVCPLICARGERVAGDHCVQVGCESGYVLNSSGSCERRHREPTPRQRTVMRPTKPPVGTPALPSATPLGGSCALDTSGHRQGGRFCRD